MFSESIRIGEYGEHAIWNLLNKQMWVRSVVDVRADRGFQSQDIDFLVENLQRQFISVEVKTDFKAQETGNIVYELSTSGNIGCFEKTQAKVIIYFVPKSQKAFLMETKVLRDYVNKSNPKKINMGDNATGYLLPISELQEQGVIKQVYEEVK